MTTYTSLARPFVRVDSNELEYGKALYLRNVAELDGLITSLQAIRPQLAAMEQVEADFNPPRNEA